MSKRRWRAAALMMAVLLVLPVCAAAREDMALGETIASLREAVTRTLSDGGKTLAMRTGFEPVVLAAEEFRYDDREFLRGLGLEESVVGDVASRTPSVFEGKEEDGGLVTVLYCGCYGETAFVFRQKAGEPEKLIDVIPAASISGRGCAQIIGTASGQTYLLVNAWEHGTGTWREWTCYYNLDTRRMELILPRNAMENLDDLTAEAVTHTNLDHALDIGEDIDTDTLIVYTYATVSRSDGSRPASVDVLISDCKVSIYTFCDGGLLKTGERVFQNVVPALIERMSVEELMNTSVQMDGREDEEKEAVQMEAGTVSDWSLAQDLIAVSQPAAITNASWVNLRQEPSKSSPSLAAIDEGETVYILRRRCGNDEGWMRVIYAPEEGRALSGYIWWSFLKE